MKQKYTTREKLDIFILFLFALAFLNRSGYIFAALLVLYFVLDSNRIVFGRSEIFLLLYGQFYFIFYLFHFDAGINEVIWYLVGPVGAFLIGKIFVRRSQRDNAFLTILLVLSLGMFAHGFLNWYAYRISNYAAQHGYLRLSVDFWRGDLVSVTSTGMLFTFAAATSTGFCFSNIPLKKKTIFAIILGVCLAITIAFANRTLLLIVIILITVELMLATRKRFQARKKILRWLITAYSVVLAVCIMLLIDFWKPIFTDILDNKLINRIQEIDSMDPRIYAWLYFFGGFNFLKHPWGGNGMLRSSLYLADGTKLNYFHNLWLDVYNIAGLLPALLLLIFTVRAFRQYRKFIFYARGTKNKTLVEVSRCWIIAVFLNCFVEPVTQGNPYYFLMILICFGAMEAQIGIMQNMINNKSV